MTTINGAFDGGTQTKTTTCHHRNEYVQETTTMPDEAQQQGVEAENHINNKVTNRKTDTPYSNLNNNWYSD